jgi:hypothetical protein
MTMMGQGTSKRNGAHPVLRYGSGLNPRDVVRLASDHSGGNGNILGVGSSSGETEAAQRRMPSAP